MGSSFVFAKAKKAEKPKVNATKRELIDWQGAAGGREIPSWVNSVLDGDNLAVANELKIDSNKTMVFVLSQRGPDLDFVKTWVDNVDARREISTSISQVAAAMNNLNENTSEERYLKKVLAEKLSQTILPGNTLGELYN